MNFRHSIFLKNQSSMQELGSTLSVGFRSSSSHCDGSKWKVSLDLPTKPTDELPAQSAMRLNSALLPTLPLCIAAHRIMAATGIGPFLPVRDRQLLGELQPVSRIAP